MIIKSNLQQTIREYYRLWELKDQWIQPDLTDALDFMLTEVAEAIDKRLRWQLYVRNNPEALPPTPRAIAVEIFDAIMMGCVALDILGEDLATVANAKLTYMDQKRSKNEYS